MLRFYSLLFLLFSGVSALAQGLPGYVLTLSGDTARGFVREKKRQRVVCLYPNAQAEHQAFRPSQIQGYGLLHQPAIRSRVVHLASGADSTLFVLPQQTGRASLYSFANETSLLLLPPTTDTLYELTAANWHLLFVQRLPSCPTASADALLKVRFTPKNVEEFVQRYNKCAALEQQPTAQASSSPWRHSLGLRIGGQRFITHASTQDRLFNNKHVRQSGWGQLASVEWAAVRANGLQTGFSGSWSHLSLTSQTYTERIAIQPTTEWQEQSSVHLLGLAVSVGKRLGHPGRPNFYVGGIFGSGFGLRATGTTFARPIGSNASFQSVSSYSEPGSFSPALMAVHMSFEGGLLLPLSARSELRLTAVYQKHLLTNMHAVGAQVSYYWFRN